MGWIGAIFNLFKVLGAVVDGVKFLYSKYQEFRANRKIKKTEEAQAQKVEANKIENDEERLKAKMEAACASEKLNDPNSNCS